MILKQKPEKPMVNVIPLDSPADGEIKRLGFFAGQITAPSDFDRMNEDDINKLFEGDHSHSR